MSEEPFLHWAGGSETGHARSENEDAWGVRPESGVAAVADGVGGAPGGEHASRIAVDAVLDALDRAPWPDRSGKARREAARRAHRQVVEAWREHPGLRGMATTLTAVRWRGMRVEGVHVGDSRAYRLDPQGLEALTRDHTPAGEQLARQGGGRDVLRTHPHSHLLLRVIGGDEHPSEAELFDLSLSGSTSVLVLCTDGVEAVLPESRFRELLAPALGGELEPAARAVLDEVLRGGAPDNVTLLLLARAGNGAAPR